MPQPQPLTFEQFIERLSDGNPRYDNFIAYFMTTGWAALAREKLHSLRFQKEQPDLDERLCQGMIKRDRSIDTEKAIADLEPDLHSAYLIMHDYGVSDEELLIKTD